MRNLLIAVFCFVFLLTSAAFAQEKKPGGSEQTSKSKQSKKKKSRKERASVIHDPANVTAINLNRTEVPAVCPPDNSCTQIIEVNTIAVDPENVPLKYVYTVSGGKIIGSGANVKWDLSGVKPGTYLITVGLDAGSGWGVLGRTETKEVKVVE